MSQDNEKRELSDAEVDELTAETLPDRENMSLVNVNADIPVNAAVGANVLSSHTSANPVAAQNAPDAPVIQR